MLKIGIITHYLNSTNYGGNLQAYALCTYLKNHGYDAQQISYDRSFDNSPPKSIVKRIKWFLRKTQKKVKRIPAEIKTVAIRKKLKQRENTVLCFNRSIPHTKVYTSKTIASCVDDFDVFITGSDQVWNPLAVCDAYLLNFVNPNKAFKMSYAASVSANELSPQIIERYKNNLNSYHAISVRENQAIKLLQSHIDPKMDWVLDPTLLISQEEWKNITTKRKNNISYMFCYFLGDSLKQRKIAEEYAKNHNLKIYALPYLNGLFRKCDKSFGDERLFDVSPENFIELIANSECVFTDSFHAVVFSVIFKKQFFVFDRVIKQSLGSRIKDLTDLFDLGYRFCNTPEKFNIDYIESVKETDYSKPFPKFENMKNLSEKYLLSNLRKAKEMKNSEN